MNGLQTQQCSPDRFFVPGAVYPPTQIPSFRDIERYYGQIRSSCVPGATGQQLMQCSNAMSQLGLSTEVSSQLRYPQSRPLVFPNTPGNTPIAPPLPVRTSTAANIAEDSIILSEPLLVFAQRTPGCIPRHDYMVQEDNNANANDDNANAYEDNGLNSQNGAVGANVALARGTMRSNARNTFSGFQGRASTLATMQMPYF